MKDRNITTNNISNNPDLDKLCIETIRFLALDAVQAANSGHPGMPMGMACTAYTLWTQFLRHNPKDPSWLNRDRFVLSAGHGSTLLYALLHLTGYDLPLDDIKRFRQWGSLTPGHPEYHHTPGVEVTTGPLGQGVANAVGMAIAQKHLAARYNTPENDIFDYNIYALAGDGCLQEGISSEACSLAGHLKLGNLILLYDNNHITIDGNTSLSFTEDRIARYKAYGWHVQVVDGDGNDAQEIARAIQNARNETDRPSLIQIRTHIGFGSPHFQDTAKAHGAPLGEDEIKLIKKNCGWDPEKTFYIPPAVAQHMQKAIAIGQQLQQQWQDKLKLWQKTNPTLAQDFNDAVTAITRGIDTKQIDKLLPRFTAGDSIATRKASGQVLDALMPHTKMIIGGSADLTPSNNTRFKGADDFSADTPQGRYIRYGVREHAMGAIMNGIATSGLLKPYAGTFMVFSDYMRGALRVSALSKHNCIFVFTHDSIGLGEDGPTHQPVEHTATLRAIPNLLTIRPADANETAQAWKFALQYTDGPVCLLLTRQGLPVIDQSKYPSAANLTKGAYVLIKPENPDLLLLATGSEVQLALDAAQQLTQQNINAQVVSMPCWELFEQQPQDYKDTVLPPTVTRRIAIEAGIEQGWYKWLGSNGVFIGMSSFGASAPGKTCFEKFGITTQAIITVAQKLM